MSSKLWRRPVWFGFEEFSIGTVVFGAYPAILGARFRGSLMGTGDADFVQFHSISAAVDGELPPVLDPVQVELRLPR